MFELKKNLSNDYREALEKHKKSPSEKSLSQAGQIDQHISTLSVKIMKEYVTCYESRVDGLIKAWINFAKVSDFLTSKVSFLVKYYLCCSFEWIMTNFIGKSSLETSYH